MASPAFILFPGPATWQIARWHAGRCDRSTADAATAAADVPAQLDTLGNAGRPVVLAVPADACLAARLATADLPRGDAKALLYRLEDHLPVPAEQVVADFVPFDRLAPTGGEDTLGVCGLLDRVRPAVDALEAAGVSVQVVVPAMLAAAQAMALADGAGPVVFLLGDVSAAPPAVSVVATVAGRPLDWASVPATVTDVRLHLRFLSTLFDVPPRLVAAGLPAALVDGLSDALSQVVAVDAAEPFAAAAATGAAALSGRGRPWVDLRRGPLAATDRLRRHRRPLNAALAALAAGLAVTAASLFARSVRCDRAADAADARGRADFADHFPGWVVPTNVRVVVAAEHRRAAAAAGAVTAAAGPAGAYGSALATCRGVLAALPPTTARFAVDRMAFADDDFQLSGRLGSYDEADAVIAAASSAARQLGMDVPTPQTRREAGGTWAYQIRAARPVRPSTAADTVNPVAR